MSSEISTLATPIGFGPDTPRIRFYIGNLPHYEGFAIPNPYRPLHQGEIAAIVAHTSNHWRKVFNVYAKLIWQWLHQAPALQDSLLPLRQEGITCWQDYRDARLFQANGLEALMFSKLPSAPQSNSLSVLAGKTYGLQQCPNAIALDTHFWIAPDARLVIAPYPDYRQLSNARIDTLVDHLCALTKS